MSLSLALLALITRVAATTPPAAGLEAVEPNDNRRPAGVLRGNVLTVQLEARTGTWHPEGNTGHGLDVAAFGELGRPLQTPGPLIRVKAGTEVHTTVKNVLGRRLMLIGLGGPRSRNDTVTVEPGATAELRFVAEAPGTYWYIGRTGVGPFGLRLEQDMQLGGAIVVDPPAAPPPSDRVFVISWWFTLDSLSPSGLGRATMAINGLSWPHTERLKLMQGDTTRWRVVNLSESDHPMHLHGFYFQVRGKGDGVRDTVYTARDRRLAVTEIVGPFRTMEMAWAPTRPGNWIFHCHFIGHLSHLSSLDTDRGKLDEAKLAHHGTDGPHQMYGLVLGIQVTPRAGYVANTASARPIRLLVRQRPNVYGSHDGFAYVLGDSPAASDPSVVPAPPGPTLVLKKGERVAVTIVNQSRKHAAVHWHGIELESFPDGVPGWSGSGSQLLPAVAPGDSITVRFTPPRAGTFMYHSHFDEMEQISSGLYGPIVVLEPGERLDAATDRVMLFSSAGPTPNIVAGPWAPIMLNGKTSPDPMEFKVGTTYRLRLINISDDLPTVVSLNDGDKPVEWRMVAKDGAALPPHQAKVRAATLLFEPGEIYDFEFTPATAGMLTLQYGPPPAPPEFNFPKPVGVRVIVR